jgi:hypothetical protein
MSEEVKELSPAEVVALSKAISETKVKTARKLLKEGETYELDFGVRVQGNLIVGVESNYSSSTKPSSSQLVQALLAQFGPRKRIQIVDLILSLGLKKAISEDEEPDADLELLAGRLVVGLTINSVGTRAGSVTADVDVSPVQWS